MQILRRTYPHAMEGSVMRANVQGNQDFCTKKVTKIQNRKKPHLLSFLCLAHPQAQSRPKKCCNLLPKCILHQTSNCQRSYSKKFHHLSKQLSCIGGMKRGKRRTETAGNCLQVGNTFSTRRIIWLFWRHKKHKPGNRRFCHSQKSIKTSWLKVDGRDIFQGWTVPHGLKMLQKLHQTFYICQYLEKPDK